MLYIYQFIVCHCVIVKGMKHKQLRRLTVYDFVNHDNGQICIREDFDRCVPFWTLTFTSWEMELLSFYFVNVRSKWWTKSKAEDLAVTLVFPNHDEKTEYWMINTAGKTDGSSKRGINYSRVVISRQQQLFGPNAHYINAHDRQKYEDLPVTPAISNPVILNATEIPHAKSTNVTTNDSEADLNSDYTQTSIATRTFPIEIDVEFPLPMDGKHRMPQKKRIK